MLFIVLFTLISQVLAKAKVASIPISAKLQPLAKGTTLVDRDRARFQASWRRHEKRAEGFKVMNTGLEYVVNVGFGSPPTYYGLVIDTGSAYTWIGEQEEYVRTETSIEQKGRWFEMRYYSGLVNGAHYKDLVTLSPEISIPNMQFGVALALSTPITNGMNGILGLGPSIDNQGRVKPDGGEPVPNIMDELFAQGKIEQNVFGLYFAPPRHRGAVNGILTVGGTDPRKHTSQLNWVETMKTGTWSGHWSFKQSIKYGRKLIQSSSIGIIDSGATLIHIAPEAFEAYSKSIPGSRIDTSTKMVEIPRISIREMKSLFFIINKVVYELTPSAQLWPRAFNHLIRGKPGAYYSVVCSLGNVKEDTKPGFILGQVFMQRYYTAYNASSSKIGFAPTSYTFADTN